MRVAILNQGGYKTGVTPGFTTSTGILTGPLILCQDPIEPMEAATKRYVDNISLSLSANNIKTGTLNASRLPAFSGDYSNLIGSNYFTLADTGVSPGTYTKVTVDSRGRILSGDFLTNADIPNFSWNKINSGKPTSIAGYGITDAVSNNGDIMNGYLFLSSDPVNDYHLATKRYVDNAVIANSELKTGVIIRRPNPSTPTGFLRCNGGELNISDYLELYNVIGDSYTVNETNGVGKPWKQQYLINTTQADDITTWANSAPLLEPLSYSQVVVTKNYIYLLGGNNGTNFVSTVYKAPINSDGTLGVWTTDTALPNPIAHAQAIAIKNKIYLLGGYDGSTYLISVLAATINPDGTLGAWTNYLELPTPVAFSQALVTKDRIYLLGGYDGAVYSSSVFYTDLDSDGNIGTWAVYSSLPVPLAFSQLVVTKNRVYLLGGSTGTYTSAVYTAYINNDGSIGSWTTAKSLPTVLAFHQSYVTKNRIYLIGGTTGTGATSGVYTALINKDGTIDTWTIGTSLPGALLNSQLAVTNNRIYMLGGYNGTAYVSNVYTSPISGGTNNYSSYYNGTIVPTTTGKFIIPDTLATDPYGIYSYIKT